MAKEKTMRIEVPLSTHKLLKKMSTKRNTTLKDMVSDWAKRSTR